MYGSIFQRDHHPGKSLLDFFDQFTLKIYQVIHDTWIGDNSGSNCCPFLNCDRWHMTGDTRHMTHDRWHLTRYTWHLTHDTWHLTNKWHLSSNTSYLTGGVALGVAFSFMWQVTGDTWILTHGRWNMNMTPDMWHILHTKWHMTSDYGASHWLRRLALQ